MKRIALLVLVLSMILSCALAAPLEAAPGFEGAVYFPEGSDESTASYRFMYRFPQVVAQSEADEAINAFFSYQLNDALMFSAPLHAEGAEENAGAYTQIAYQITCNDDEYFSVLFSQEQFQGAASNNNWTAFTFFRQGENAGEPVSLANILGLSNPLENDGLGYERSTEQSSVLVYDLIWEIIEEKMQNGEGDFFEGLTKADLEAEFYPENDFYMDQDRNLVFFIQPAMIATSAAGILTFPFSIDELLSEL